MISLEARAVVALNAQVVVFKQLNGISGIMKKNITRLVVLSSLLAMLLMPREAAANDWPQWRGPDRTDISKETGVLKQWPKDGPKQVWLNKDGGLGYSGFSIVGGKLFTMGARDGKEFLIALDANTGKQLWCAEIGTLLTNNWGDGPRGTPTVDAGRVYALGGQGTLVCCDAAGGKLFWKKTMQELGGKVPTWGYTESPLVDGKLVVCTPGGAQGAIAALDKITGNVVWQSKEFTDGAQYSSLIAVNHNGARQYIQLTMQSVAGVGGADGKLLWRSEWPGKVAVIPTPIFHDGCVYVASGYNAGCKLVKVAAGNQVSDVYVNTVIKNHHGGVVLVGDHLYGYSDGAGWVCQNFKTGEQVWAEKKALGKGAIGCCTEGLLYCLEESNGKNPATVVLIEASPKGWKEHGRFTLDPQTTQRSAKGRIWTHPVVANGKLYLRDQELIFCFDVKAT
jgi:outer membrane protein assembly factor BamB